MLPSTANDFEELFNNSPFEEGMADVKFPLTNDF
jgi:hypothetical protein